MNRAAPISWTSVVSAGPAALRAGPPRYYARHIISCAMSAYGSPVEADHLRQVEALATAVGGRRSREGGGPSRRFLRRLERASRVAS
jgi:hypothetical protein